MNKTKIAISGIGAVGGYYGGLLAARYKDSEDIDIYFISRVKTWKRYVRTASKSKIHS